MSPCAHEDTYIHMPKLWCQESREGFHLQLRSLDSDYNSPLGRNNSKRNFANNAEQDYTKYNNFQQRHTYFTYWVLWFLWVMIKNREIPLFFASPVLNLDWEFYKREMLYEPITGVHYQLGSKYQLKITIVQKDVLAWLVICVLAYEKRCGKIIWVLMMHFMQAPGALVSPYGRMMCSVSK